MAARVEIGFVFVQEVGIMTRRVGAGKMPIRVRNMLLTSCCFVQKLLEVRTVVGLLLGGVAARGLVAVVVPVCGVGVGSARCFSCERAFYNH